MVSRQTGTKPVRAQGPTGQGLAGAPFRCRDQLLSPDQRELCGLARHRRSKEITTTLNKMTCVVKSHPRSITKPTPIFNYAATSIPVVTTEENEVQRGDGAAGGHNGGGGCPHPPTELTPTAQKVSPRVPTSLDLTPTARFIQTLCETCMILWQWNETNIH